MRKVPLLYVFAKSRLESENNRKGLLIDVEKVIYRAVQLTGRCLVNPEVLGSRKNSVILTYRTSFSRSLRIYERLT